MINPSVGKSPGIGVLPQSCPVYIYSWYSHTVLLFSTRLFSHREFPAHNGSVGKSGEIVRRWADGDSYKQNDWKSLERRSNRMGIFEMRLFVDVLHVPVENVVLTKFQNPPIASHTSIPSASDRLLGALLTADVSLPTLCPGVLERAC